MANFKKYLRRQNEMKAAQMQAPERSEVSPERSEVPKRSEVSKPQSQNIPVPFKYHFINRNKKVYNGYVNSDYLNNSIPKKECAVVTLSEPIGHVTPVIALDFDTHDGYDSFQELEEDLINSCEGETYLTTSISPSGKLKGFLKVSDEGKLLNKTLAEKIVQDILPKRLLDNCDMAGMSQCFLTPKTYNAIARCLKEKEVYCNVEDFVQEVNEDMLDGFGVAYRASVVDLLIQSGGFVDAICSVSLELIAKYLSFHFARLKKGEARLHVETTATLLNCSKATASRIINLLKDVNILEQTKGYIPGKRAKSYGFTEAALEILNTTKTTSTRNHQATLDKVAVLEAPFTYGKVNEQTMAKVRAGTWLGLTDREMIELCMRQDAPELHICKRAMRECEIKAIIKNWKSKRSGVGKDKAA